MAKRKKKASKDEQLFAAFFKELEEISAKHGILLGTGPCGGWACKKKKKKGKRYDFHPSKHYGKNYYNWNAIQ